MTRPGSAKDCCAHTVLWRVGHDPAPARGAAVACSSSLAVPWYPQALAAARGTVALDGHVMRSTAWDSVHHTFAKRLGGGWGVGGGHGCSPLPCNHSQWRTWLPPRLVFPRVARLSPLPALDGPVRDSTKQETRRPTS